MTKEKKNAFGLPTRQSDVHPPADIPRAQLMAARKLLLAEKADPLIAKAISIALDDDHPGQMSSLKMLVDRLLPMGEFEAVKGGTRNNISITISGVGDSVIQGNSEDIEEVR